MKRTKRTKSPIRRSKKQTPHLSDDTSPSYDEYKQFVDFMGKNPNYFGGGMDPHNELWDYLLFGGNDDDDDEYEGGAGEEKIPAVKGKRCPNGTHRKGKWCVPTEARKPVAQGLVPPTKEEVEMDVQKKPAKTAMNQFLEEKEGLERRNPLKDHDFLYPATSDPEFNEKIAAKKEFSDSKYDGKIYDVEKQSDMLCSATFELSPHQVFVRNFLSEQTPYRGLLLYHGLGTGKTCSAIGVAEETRHYLKRIGVKQQIIVVASPNVQGNFRLQLFDERKLRKITNDANQAEFTWNIESCLGNSLLNEINPNSMRNLTKDQLKTNVNKIINENYVFMGYIQFANIVKYTAGSIKEREEENIRRFFDNRLIIVDEVHNIRIADDSNQKEMQQVGATLMSVAKHARGVRLLLLSATPMFNSYKEIVWITNLLNLNDNRSQIQVSDVFNADGSFRLSTNPAEEGGEELLTRKLTGYVSYVRGENPYTFPFRVYPSVFSPEHGMDLSAYPKNQMNGRPIENPLQNIDVYVNRVAGDTYQMRVYGAIIENLRQKTQAGTGMPTFENMESFGYTLLQRPLESLNIVYPNDDVARIVAAANASVYSDDLFQNVVGGVGLARVLSFTTMENEEPLKHNYEYLPAIQKKFGRVFSPAELPKYSVKMAEVCRAVRNSEGIVLIYSQYIDGGVVPMALALEEMGFQRYCSGYGARHKHLFKRPASPAVDAITMLPRAADTPFQPAQYIIISGDKGLSPSNNEDVKYATNSENIDGSKVKVIIISKAGSEGLDFKAIRQIHILEPWFNMNRIEQIIGRGVRNLSHCELPFKKRNVEIYLHSTVIEGSEEEAADLYLYRLAERKAVEIGRVSRLIKDTAADCLLNIGQANFTVENLSRIEENRDIHIQVSSKKAEIAFQVGDVDGSEICDYTTCRRECRVPNKGNEKGPETGNEKTTYTEFNVNSNIHYIVSRIKALYRDRHVYTLSQLTSHINAVRIYPVEQIYYVLSKFVKNKNMLLVDGYGRFGYLINRDKYYEFQPIEITDERVPMFDRSRPVEYKQPNFILEVPREFREPEQERERAVAIPRTNGDYRDIVLDIEMNLRLLETPQPIKSDEKNWYKNASHVIEHVKTVYGFTDEDITRYVVFHYLDSSNYPTKRTLFENSFKSRIFEISPAVEAHIVEYFGPKIMRSRVENAIGIFLADKEETRLVMTDMDGEPEWKEGDNVDATMFGDAKIKKDRLNDVVGYMIQFKDQDMAFYYKDIHLKRNNKGRRCDRSGGKEPIITILNRIVDLDRYNAYNTNSSFFYSGSLCVVMEMIMRHKHAEGRRIYYLSPEEAIQNNITKYSKA
jgi:hypothetical protein